MNGRPLPPSRDLRLVHVDARERQSVVSLRGASGPSFGGKELAICAGPCAVESYEQIVATAAAVAGAGANVLRGGAYKPRTSPYSFQGLGRDGLAMMREAADLYGLAVVTEVLDPRDAAIVAESADMLQIGARNMQNTALLRAVGETGKPVLLKRGLAATVDEWLLAAEYIALTGNEQIVLCERGIRSFDPSTRNLLDLSVVPLLARRTHLPAIVDPSHGTGIAALVAPMGLAAVAAGAAGIMVEVHPDPASAVSDGMQSLTFAEFESFMESMPAVAAAVGRSLPKRFAGATLNAPPPS
ncbi:MAG: 3-deoxy-7-phosphoheptulonate synthase [Candidatus Eremiobacteraeota bacterium]|nr:3-deoxy-7-phosphoheptulonate synthase [Candidatus Eremiobacteraeota bacterium]